MLQRKLSIGKFRSFKYLITSETVYVDKTAPLCELANMEECFVLTRPRRMGKSTLISTLEYLFSHGTVGTEGLACHELWNEPFRYFVMHFDWSRCKASTPEGFIRSFINQMHSYADIFGVDINSKLDLGTIFEGVVTGILSKLADKNFLEQHPELSQGDRPLCTDQIVLLIDEYDAPMTHCLENDKDLSELIELYSSFFISVKALSPLRFVLITGVSSYAQTSIFSGANQFINISLLDNYATCCGYTHAELEKYMKPELEHAQEVLKLTHDELMERLTYHYDGYLFSEDCDESKRVFSPVSVSSFLQNPMRGFMSYWSETGAKTTFLFKMLKLCSREVIETLLNQILPQNGSNDFQQDAILVDYINKWCPFLSIASDKNNLDEHDMLTLQISSLVLKIDMCRPLLGNDAIVVLFQSGYLSIKSIEGGYATLGIANHEVLFSFCALIVEHLSFNSANESITKLLKKLHRNYSHAMTSLQNGGNELASFINDILNTAPRELFAKGNYENVVTYVISLALQYAAIPANREVAFVSGRADLVIYKPETKVLTPDVIIEFKVAREEDSVTDMLMKGCNQIIDRKYGICQENPNPKRYCIVISNVLKMVGAIASVDANNGIVIEYQSDRLDAKGKIQS